MKRTIKIFASSPSDVDDERKILKAVISDLRGRYRSFVDLEEVFWETSTILANSDFQDKFDPSDCDLVIGILWSRLGSPLSAKYNGPDGTSRMGTEWELEKAFEASENHPEKKPGILIYRRDQARPQYSDPFKEAKAREQWEYLEQYLSCHYHYEDKAGTIKRFIRKYPSVEEFAERIRSDIENRVLSLIPGVDLNTVPTAVSGCPFKKLSAFNFHDRNLFFGRKRVIHDVQEKVRKDIALRKRREREPSEVKRGDSAKVTSFVLLYGGSGFGKSSLMQAGVAPQLTARGGVMDGESQWRRVLFEPSDGEGSLVKRLAATILEGPSKEDIEELRWDESFPVSGVSEMRKVLIPQIKGPVVWPEFWDVDSIANAFGTALETFIRSLESCLVRNRLYLLLQIDQMEEVFRIASSKAELEAFFRVVYHLCRANRVVGIATMRSEYFPEIAKFNYLSTLVKESEDIILSPPSTQMLNEVIRYPAAAARLKFETAISPPVIDGRNPVSDNLADQLLEDAQSSPEALPLLEFCLTELYNQWEQSTKDLEEAPSDQGAARERILTWKSYKEMKGLWGAIAAKADETVASLSNVSWSEVESSLFAALVFVNPVSGEVSRKRTPLHAFAEGSSVEEAAKAFVEARILVTKSSKEEERTDVVLAHDSLLVHWPRLSEWIESHKDALTNLARLEASTEEWVQQARKKSLYLTGGRLESAKALEKDDEFNLTEDQKEFIQKSWRLSRMKWRVLQGAVVVFAAMAVVAIWMAREAKESALAERKSAVEADKARLAAEDSARQEEEAKNAAVTERQKAEDALTTTSSVLSEFLFDLAPELSDLGFSLADRGLLESARRHLEQHPSKDESLLSALKSMIFFLEFQDLKNSGSHEEARQKARELFEVTSRLVAESSPSSESFRTHLEAFISLGDSTRNIEGYERALKDYTDGVEFFEEIDDEQTKIDCYPSLFRLKVKIAECNERISGFSQALRNYESALKIAELINPEDIYLNSPIIAYCYQKIGEGNLVNGRVIEARDYLRESMRLAEENYEAHPSSSNRRQLADSLSGLGDASEREGDIEGAKSSFERALKIRAALYELMKDEESARGYLISKTNLSLLVLETEGAEAALKGLQESLVLAAEIYEMSETVRNRYSLARANYELALCFNYLRLPTEAKRHLEEAFRLAKSCFEQQSTHEHQKLFAVVGLDLSWVYYLLKDILNSRKVFEDVSDDVQVVFEREPSRANNLLNQKRVQIGARLGW